jgi:hypothetical protein
MPTRDPETIQKAIDKLGELIALQLKQIETERELRRALMIMKIAPTIDFKTKVRTRTEGMHYSALGGDVVQRNTVFVVSDANGLEVKVPIFDVPTELWPERDRQLRYVKRSYPNIYAGIVAREGINDQPTA